MGNHDVGRAMNAAAKGFWAGNGDTPVTKEKALAVLDAAAEEFRGADAEFDDYLDKPGEPLNKLVAIAFGPWEPSPDLNDNALCDEWYEKIRRPFSDRYEFC